MSELDAELAKNGARTGETLSWTAAERQILALIVDAVDRRVELNGMYAAAEGPKLKVQLSTEIRLLDGSIERLLRKINTTVPEAESQKTIAARRAAHTRWQMHPA